MPKSVSSWCSSRLRPIGAVVHARRTEPPTAHGAALVARTAARVVQRFSATSVTSQIRWCSATGRKTDCQSRPGSNHCELLSVLSRVAISGAIEAPVSTRIPNLRGSDCGPTSGVLAQCHAIGRDGHMCASVAMDLVVPVGLSVAVNEVKSHGFPRCDAAHESSIRTLLPTLLPSP